MKKNKILHIITTAEMGGAQLSTLRLLCLLQDSNLFDLHLLYGEAGPLESDYAELREKGIIVIRNPLLCRSFHPMKDFLLFISLILFFRKNRFDLIHTHCSKPSLVARVAALFSGVKAVVHTFHGFGHEYYRNPLLQKLHITLESLLNKKSAALVFVAKENLHRAEHIGLTPFHSPKNHIIPDCLAFEKLSIRSYAPHQELCIGSVSNFKDQKQPFLLIELFKKISLLYPQARFLVAGEGKGLSSCRKHAENLNISNIVFLGAVKDMPFFYSRLSLFVSTSRFEGLSMAELECLYLGIPMVIPFRGGITEIMRDGEQGYFYPFGNLVTALSRCREILEGRFTFTPLPPEWMKIYDSGSILKSFLNLYNSCIPFHTEKPSLPCK